MRIIIIGAGTAGRRLAARLCDDKHDVVLIDQSRADLDQVDANLDIFTIEGDGTDPYVLESAGLAKADLMVAVTNSDAVNVLSCAMAHAVGVKRKIARVASTHYTHPPKNFDLSRLGIDLFVSQQAESARELYNIIRIPGSQEVLDLLDGAALCAGFMIPTDSPMLFASLKDFPKPDALAEIRFIAYQRGNKVHIPEGNTHFHIGDMVYLVGNADNVAAFLHFACPSESMYSRVVIAGGGELGLQFAQLMERTTFKITLVESDSHRAEYCSDELDHALVINGSAVNQDIMEQVGINDQTAFIAVTGDEENNIMSCLVAEKMGAHFTAAKIENTDYAPIISSLSLLDRVISPHSALINAIYHNVRGKSVRAESILQQIPGELLEIALPGNSNMIGKNIMQVKLPAGAIIAMYKRSSEVQIIDGNYVFRPGDTLLIYATRKAVDKVNALFD